MSFSNDRELGAIEFSRAIITGEGTTPEVASLQAYGLYLMHGGTPKGFMSMTEDDVQVMYSAYLSTMAHERRELLKDLVKIIEKMFKV